MATWVTPKQTWVGDDVVAASNMNDIGGDLQFLYDWSGTLGYAETSSTQTGITTEADLTSLTVTVTIPAGGRRIKITGFVHIQSTVVGDLYAVHIKESTTQLNSAQAEQGRNVIVQSIITPTAGSHTYKLSALRTSGTGSLSTVTSATELAFILVEAL